MNRRSLLTVGLAAGSILCALPAAAMVEQLGSGEGEVSIVVWPGKIERGKTDEAFGLVSDLDPLSQHPRFVALLHRPEAPP